MKQRLRFWRKPVDRQVRDGDREVNLTTGSFCVTGGGDEPPRPRPQDRPEDAPPGQWWNWYAP